MKMTTIIRGQRLQPTCRALGLPFEEDGEWVETTRGYPDRFRVSGVKLTPDDAEKLKAHIAAKTAREELKRYHRWLESHQPQALIDAQRAKKRASNERKLHRELADIITSVSARWRLDPDDVAAFAAHANTPGEGRVVRSRSTCNEDFDTKVYMALVAWVRHNHTNYDDELSAAKAAAYAEYNSMRPDFAAGERWSDCAYSRDETDEALDTAREEAQTAHHRLHAQYTAEAVAWLKAREHCALEIAAQAA